MNDYRFPPDNNNAGRSGPVYDAPSGYGAGFVHDDRAGGYGGQSGDNRRPDHNDDRVEGYGGGRRPYNSGNNRHPAAIASAPAPYLHPAAYPPPAAYPQSAAPTNEPFNFTPFQPFPVPGGNNPPVRSFVSIAYCFFVFNNV